MRVVIIILRLYLLVNGVRREKQGFPKISVAIPVVHAIAEKMLQALEQRKPMIQPEEQLLLFENRINVYALASLDFIIGVGYWKPMADGC